MAAFPAGQMLNADAAAIQLEIGDLSVEELEQLMEDISLVAFMLLTLIPFKFQIQK